MAVTNGRCTIAGWREELRELAASLESRLRRGTNALERLVDRDSYHIAAYRGYGRSGRVLVLARVLEDEGLPVAEAGHDKARNLLAMAVAVRKVASIRRPVPVPVPAVTS